MYLSLLQYRYRGKRYIPENAMRNNSHTVFFMRNLYRYLFFLSPAPLYCSLFVL